MHPSCHSRRRTLRALASIFRGFPWQVTAPSGANPHPLSRIPSPPPAPPPAPQRLGPVPGSRRRAQEDPGGRPGRGSTAGARARLAPSWRSTTIPRCQPTTCPTRSGSPKKQWPSPARRATSTCWPGALPARHARPDWQGSRGGHREVRGISPYRREARVQGHRRRRPHAIGDSHELARQLQTGPGPVRPQRHPPGHPPGPTPPNPM
jgi:hypothetical protein